MQQKIRITVLVVERKRKILYDNHSPIGLENGYCFSKKVRESSSVKMSSQPQSKIGLQVSSLPAQMKGVSRCIRVTPVWRKTFYFQSAVEVDA